jgi:hypothetical protein
MRVMVMVKATEDSEQGRMPTPELAEAMMAYNEQLVQAGILVAGDGLKPSSAGVRVHFDGSDRTVSEGPFANVGDLVAGFWIWEVESMAHAVGWVKKCPNPMFGPSDIDIRPFYPMADFGDAFSPELQALGERLDAEVDAKHGKYM